MAEILKALEYIKSASFNNGNIAGHPNSVSQATSMTKVPDGSKIMGWILQATTNATSSGNSTSSRNHGFPQATGSENVYPNGKILAEPSLRIFTYSELQDATRNFSIDVGEGKFGRVYKGLLHEKSKSKSGTESLIAVKRVPRSQYRQSGVDLLGRLSHPNLVKLLGCCLENKDPLFVYEFMQRGSLHGQLFGRGSGFQLPWAIRLKVLIGAARGLAFLHKTEKQGVFNQKNEGESFYEYFEPSKILLDADYNAKISGFNVAKIDPSGVDYVYEPHRIIFEKERDVYPAPEYIFEGLHLPTWCFSSKSDVYGFGVLLVQMLTGVDVYHPSIANTKLLRKVMDPELKSKYPIKAVEKMAQLAVHCLQYEPESRPSMEQVVDILETIDSLKTQKT